MDHTKNGSRSSLREGSAPHTRLWQSADPLSSSLPNCALSAVSPSSFSDNMDTTSTWRSCSREGVTGGTTDRSKNSRNRAVTERYVGLLYHAPLHPAPSWVWIGAYHVLVMFLPAEPDSQAILPTLNRRVCSACRPQHEGRCSSQELLLERGGRHVPDDCLGHVFPVRNATRHLNPENGKGMMRIAWMQKSMN